MILHLAAVLGLTASATAWVAPVEEAQARAAFTRYDEGWRTYNLQEVVDAFPVEFDWVNSVGTRIVDGSVAQTDLGTELPPANVRFPPC